MTVHHPREEPTHLPGSEQTLSLVEGTTVVTTDLWGRFTPGSTHGVYHRDVRVLSGYRVTIDDRAPSRLQAARRGSTRLDAAFASAFTPEGDARAVLLLHRSVTGGEIRDEYTLHRLVPGPAMVVRLSLETDFAQLLEVKHTQRDLPPRPWHHTARSATATDNRGSSVAVTIEGPEPDTATEGCWEWVVPEGDSRWSVSVQVTPRVNDGSPSNRPRPAAPVGALVVRSSDYRWAPAVRSALDDLRGLWMSSEAGTFVGAGAPWFMALFGRDTLLTAYAALPAGAELALSTLEALAARQGRRHDERTLEQPGRILHELRTGQIGVFGLDPGEPYYGSTDATPLFAYLLSEAYRWGADEQRVAALLPAARAAVDWCRIDGDIDGDGFVESVPHVGGLENQGWKDSGDSMVHADGTQAEGPFSLIEVQAYYYGALQGLALLEERIGAAENAATLRTEAAQLQQRVLESFWLPDRDLLAMGLDRRKRPMAVAASNMGHALWTGLVTGDIAQRIARRLTDPDLSASWGIRTLGTNEPAYSPLAYHRGTVWPHDTAIIVHGLARSGAMSAARRVASSLLDAAEACGWRLPELLAGFGREVVDAPVPYPAACNPQAWSATAPLLALRAVLGLEPDVPAGVLRVVPDLEPWELIEVEGLRLGARDVTITATGSRVDVVGGGDLTGKGNRRTNVLAREAIDPSES